MTVDACEAAELPYLLLGGTAQPFGQPFPLTALLLGNVATLQALCILANLASRSPLVLHILPMGPGKISLIIDKSSYWSNLSFLNAYRGLKE